MPPWAAHLKMPESVAAWIQPPRAGRDRAAGLRCSGVDCFNAAKAAAPVLLLRLSSMHILDQHWGDGGRDMRAVDAAGSAEQHEGTGALLRRLKV